MLRLSVTAGWKLSTVSSNVSDPRISGALSILILISICAGQMSDISLPKLCKEDIAVLLCLPPIGVWGFLLG